MGKQFHLGDILSIMTGRLVSPRHIEGVYDILGYMLDDQLYTHQLPRASRECQPYLLEQHPQLALVTGEEVTMENWQSWLEARVREYGEYLEVFPVRPEDVVHKDPLEELAEMVPPEKIIVVAI